MIRADRVNRDDDVVWYQRNMKIRVSKMTFICLLDFIYLNILTILIALMKVVEAPKSTL